MLPCVQLRLLSWKAASFVPEVTRLSVSPLSVPPEVCARGQGQREQEECERGRDREPDGGAREAE